MSIKEKPIATVEDFQRIAQSNPVLWGVWNHWKHGTYRSWEEALLHTAVLLSEENDVLRKELLEGIQQEMCE